MAIFAVIAAANASDHPGLIPAAIALVEGLHFFPLSRLYDQHQYRWTAALLTAIALTGLALYATGTPDEAVRATVGLASAATLWASAYHLALRG
ncbi:DUF7010 family protein [Streptomyces sp. NPDC059897]|uniref:DUF7010 family protein n=1 Tax=Streptomyces sp. NPDC059897 TaxID=3346994 RepID=UPI003665284E